VGQELVDENLAVVVDDLPAHAAIMVLVQDAAATTRIRQRFGDVHIIVIEVFVTLDGHDLAAGSLSSIEATVPDRHWSSHCALGEVMESQEWRKRTPIHEAIYNGRIGRPRISVASPVSNGTDASPNETMLENRYASDRRLANVPIR
jgi:hypothetical protein